MNEKLYSIYFEEGKEEIKDSDSNIIYYTSINKAREAIGKFAVANDLVTYYNDDLVIKAICPESDEIYVFEIIPNDMVRIFDADPSDWDNIRV
jgi:hypothetical protein